MRPEAEGPRTLSAIEHKLATAYSFSGELDDFAELCTTRAKVTLAFVRLVQKTQQSECRSEWVLRHLCPLPIKKHGASKRMFRALAGAEGKREKNS